MQLDFIILTGDYFCNFTLEKMSALNCTWKKFPFPLLPLTLTSISGFSGEPQMTTALFEVKIIIADFRFLLKSFRTWTFDSSLDTLCPHFSFKLLQPVILLPNVFTKKDFHTPSEMLLDQTTPLSLW